MPRNTTSLDLILRKSPEVLRLALLTFSLLALLGSPLAAQTCPTGAGTTVTSVAFIDADGNGITDKPSASKTRREHARISEGLASALGITVTEGADVNPQIRVVVDTPLLPSGKTSTALFTVTDVIEGDSSLRLEVYDREDASDEDSGYFKLFEERSPVTLSTVSVTVHAAAPSSTTTNVDGGSANGGTTTVEHHFCEPNGGAHPFTERVDVWSDKRLALLVPHGGNIEELTSAQIATIASTLAGHGIDANVWETGGSWFDDDFESEHWHITSSAVSPASFPGLGALLEEPGFDDDRAFRYAVSLHGFGDYDGKGLVLGGRAHLEAKCLLANRIQQRLIDEGRGAVGFYLWDLEEANNLELPDANGDKISDPDQRGSDVGLSGTDRDNVVNRLSPSESDSGLYGGFQVEESPSLRQDAVYRELVAEEIAHTIALLIERPEVIDPDDDEICQALVAGDPAPTAELRGRVWRDLDGDGLQETGEDGVAGVTVELLENAAVVATTATGADGSYAFPRLEGDDYRLRVVLPTGFSFSPRDVDNGQADTDEVDSDVDTTTGETAEITLDDGELLTSLDAGLERLAGTASIGDRAWLDDDADGYQHVSEGGFEGIAVELLNPEGIVLATDATDEHGEYLFDDLAASDYRLRFSTPAGYELTVKKGDQPTLNSDADPTTGETGTISLASSEVNSDVDAGFRVPCYRATLVAYASEWRTSSSHEADWEKPAFADGNWDEAQATLGYPASEVVAEIDDVGVTSYFRLRFEVEDPSIFAGLELSLFRNDGAVVYLNGTQVLSSNLPSTVADGTYALSSSETTVTATLGWTDLAAGENVLAVEVHEADDASGDLLFDLELVADVCQPCVRRETFELDRGTFVRSGRSTVYGGEATIELDGSPEKNGLLAWDLGDLPDDAEVLHAELEVSVVDRASESYRIFPVLRAWDETQANWEFASTSPEVKWQTAGANGTTDFDEAEPLAIFRFPVVTASGVVVLNVSGRELVESWISAPAGNHGLIIPGDDDQGGLDIESDNSPNPPQLHVVYATGCSE